MVYIIYDKQLNDNYLMIIYFFFLEMLLFRCILFLLGEYYIWVILGCLVKFLMNGLT